jgi:tRNA pseudouridine55 synthase
MIGRMTKQCETFMNQPKQYEATIRLGATTETDDIESPEQLSTSSSQPDAAQIDAALKKFEGEIDQIPPAYSALKIRGRRACDRIRAGETIELKPRRVRIDRIELLTYVWPLAKVRVDCGRGTYIRSIARDIGKSLSVGGYLSQLRRTRSGNHRVDDAATIQQLQLDGVEPHLLQPT